MGAPAFSVLAKLQLKGLLSYLLSRAYYRFFSGTNAHFEAYIFGSQVTLMTQDLEQKYLALDCVREPENLVVYKALAEASLVDGFLDIGANCGHVAASIVDDYATVHLFEPNPKLADLLRKIFALKPSVVVHECAIVDIASVGTMKLSVPRLSSGSASLGQTDFLVKQDHSFDEYTVRTVTFENEMASSSLARSFIKIDVEGFEENVISSSAEYINRNRAIVGFEALSLDLAVKCSSYFKNYEFYCARFDFIENGGALTSSGGGIVKALTKGGNISVLKLHDLPNCGIRNFSQIYAVPTEKQVEFESAVKLAFLRRKYLDLPSLKTWGAK
jgi:FkbM family methyltransferase